MLSLQYCYFCCSCSHALCFFWIWNGVEISSCDELVIHNIVSSELKWENGHIIIIIFIIKYWFDRNEGRLQMIFCSKLYVTVFYNRMILVGRPFTDLYNIFSYFYWENVYGLGDCYVNKNKTFDFREKMHLSFELVGEWEQNIKNGWFSNLKVLGLKIFKTKVK